VLVAAAEEHLLDHGVAVVPVPLREGRPDPVVCRGFWCRAGLCDVRPWFPCGDGLSDCAITVLPVRRACNPPKRRANCKARNQAPYRERATTPAPKDSPGKTTCGSLCHDSTVRHMYFVKVSQTLRVG
jgi:hypothetical protein